jgi:hypothetical protein
VTRVWTGFSPRAGSAIFPATSEIANDPASPFERRPTDLNEAEAQIAAILALLATAACGSIAAATATHHLLRPRLQRLCLGGLLRSPGLVEG